MFRTHQSNAAEQAGSSGGIAYYRGVDARSTGVEFELAGELARGWNASVNYTKLAIKDEHGAAARQFIPRQLLRLSSTYRVPTVDGLQIGASLNWQDDTSVEDGDTTVRQPAYAVLGLMARYRLNRHLDLALNVNNATDKKYLTSLYWTQSYYAAPRNASVTLNWTY